MYRYFVKFLIAGGVFLRIAAAMSVKLTPSLPPPEPLGTVVSWSAAVSGQGSGTLWYRFRTRMGEGEFRMVRDYGPPSTLEWTPVDREGIYQVEVSVQDKGTGEIATDSVYFEWISRVTDRPAISETAHPMVFLYSAPGCAAGSRMSVQFEAEGVPAQKTSAKACHADASMNFYLAGMRSGTTYTVRQVVESGTGAASGGPALKLTTPDVSPAIAGYNVVKPLPDGEKDGLLLQATIYQMAVATDLSGNLVWYYPGAVSFLTRAEPGGYFFAIGQNPSADPSYQFVREVDLAGNTVLETNAARVSEQLTAMGMRAINSFHHEAERLPDGNIMVLANTEQIFTDVQGPGPVDVIGDMIVVLDRNLQVVWAWDAFDHLDVSRAAVLGETCRPTDGGCPPFYLADVANDWLHGNSLDLTPDGNILYSARHQDWLIKIDYNNGQGSGEVLWRLGKDGDFAINSADPQPWFSHQHDSRFESGDGTMLMVFDNGNTRNAADPNAHSRGQVLRLDEANRTATLALNADLGDYSFALGATQKLANGNYHFGLGYLSGDRSQAVEVDAAGNTVYALEAAVPAYRSYRVSDLYTPY